MAASLTLQPPTRLDSVEIAVDVKLEHRRRMIRRPAGRCRIDAIEPEGAKFQRIDEHIDRAYRIALVDPIIKAFRQQRPLLAVRPLNKTLHQPPAIQQGNHSIDGVFTQSGPCTDIVLGLRGSNSSCFNGRIRRRLAPPSVWPYYFSAAIVPWT